MGIWHSYAKINWYLRILDRRPDGYHNLETVFQEVELADRLVIEPIEEPRCIIEGMPFDLPLEKNLIYRAWARLREAFPEKVGGIRVEVDKRIPDGGGLGGGSSNAATTLCAVNDIFSLGLSSQTLEHIGAELGSDVPFFVRGGCAVGRGRGEILEAVERVQPFEIGLVFPSVRTSTAEAYRRLAELSHRPTPSHPLDGVLEALRVGDETFLSSAAFNDFDAVYGNEDWYRDGVALLKELGFERCILSGSGSTLIGIKNPHLSLKKTLEPRIFERPIQERKDAKWLILRTRVTFRTTSERK
ncbi:MAG: 4-(cytidine 5'-diphospho)-2-C-methyl-D-erythritol kinase [Candidatus Hydrogenedentota bacterium]|jgi:4-diphosphocytidyl-2-C-methyl-D-erythritol kinase|uniref:4-diphosphocytidyl-2-C-methyl-D-erythritol kinase n=1 Tax=Sumerlaea chitinivorans TaxID=2250252 RepID=A0A2Z4Y5E9_SUMC1|nr:4-diphosphocytidyl-2-C-methyl-D-erythritol kinase [Candidatus Sumerlaea chitinivorans]MCX7964268.1 4-(cytidine 5'-diphospho)-2-C-methyl-D-erythritol kinase [Candidatus Sumerlaea chitinivorans]RMH24627.1 MAG: 4-(cytidine 5'-diphospho)-2-C-methyl-D-erythritol kinase [Candidatus Hydrogenedentota bacterium]GIX45767.1 MAG: 4-diphosphocytidyl-2-C-methyl-D-erythritol kinase [Candidatus Sumerlaea sp.]